MRKLLALALVYISPFVAPALYVLAQNPAPKPTVQPAPTPAAQAIPAPQIVEIKETTDSLKLQLALEKEKSIGLQAQNLQTQALQSIEPQMGPLREEYKKQDAVISEAEAKVRKENDLPPNVSLDRNPQSPTFGKWTKPSGPIPLPEPPKK